MKKVEDLAVPFIISLVIITIWEVPAIMASRSSIMPTQPAILSLIIIALLPAVPVIYGWITGNQTGALIIGVMPLLILGLIIPIQSGDFLNRQWVASAIAYWGTLMFIAGLAGYFAAKKELKSLVVSGILVGVWFAVFVSGLN
ncbi:MAG: hypothetical protein WC379_05905 [Methanoregula sp.]|jgi:hypothetical protein